MAKLNIEDFTDMEEFAEALKKNYTRDELAKNPLLSVKNLYKYFNVPDISIRCKSIITKKCQMKTFVSVRKYFNEHEIYKMAMGELSKTLSKKMSFKYFKSYGVTYPPKVKIVDEE